MKPLSRVPWALLVFAAAFFVPAAGSRYYTFLANDVVIWALFATSLHLLVGYTGLASFGHAAHFGLLTVAFAQIVWAICFKWNEVTGGEQGMPEIPYPDFGWLERVAAWLPIVRGYRASGFLYFLRRLP